MLRIRMIILGVLLIVIQTSYSQVPKSLSYQGILSDSLGNPKPNGEYLITFRLYESNSGGIALWSESKTLQVERGLFYTILGDQSQFPDSVKFDRQYWLSIQVGAKQELTPRIPLTSVGYSINSIHAERAERSMIADSAVRTAPVNFVDSARVAYMADVATTAQHATIADSATKIPQQVFPDSVRAASKADEANFATDAQHATVADSATKIPLQAFPDSVRAAFKADIAANAQHALVADSATKIPLQVFPDSVRAASKADEANFATEALHASVADSATKIPPQVFPDSVRAAFKADNADLAQHAQVADSARIAGNLPTTAELNIASLSVNGDVNVAYGSSYSIGGFKMIRFDSSYQKGNLHLGTTIGSYSTYGNDYGFGNTSLRVNLNSVPDNYGIGNTFMGLNTGSQNTEGDFNSFFGANAGFGNTVGDSNTYVGAGAGNSANPFTGTTSKNTYVGALTGAEYFYGGIPGTEGYPERKSENTFIGYASGFSNLTDGSTFVGAYSGAHLNGENSAFNTFVGYTSGYNASGLGNVFVGAKTGVFHTSGDNNTYIGAWISWQNPLSGNYNTYLGSQAEGIEGLTNATAIGANAKVTSSNSLVLGDSSVNVGIGTTAPTEKLEVVGNIKVGNATIRSGTGSPEGVVTGNVGDMYLRTDGGAGSTLYIKESGNATNTGWAAK